MQNLSNLKSASWEVVANNIVVREPAGRINIGPGWKYKAIKDFRLKIALKKKVWASMEGAERACFYQLIISLIND